MKHFTISTIVVLLVQPLAMYLFLRVLAFGFFLSAGLAALLAAVAAIAIARLTSHRST
jgi:hypothetical protein